MAERVRGRLKPRETTLDADGVVLNVAEGERRGPPLLLLHGLAARWQAFAPLLPALAHDWFLLLPDFRGHGKSAWTPGRYELPDFADDAVAVLRSRADGVPGVIYGHSLGGWVALWIGAQFPELVSAIVVGDSSLYPREIDPQAAISYLSDLPLAMRSLATSVQQLDPEVMAAFHQGRLADRYNPDVAMQHVRCPTLLLQADPDRGGLMSDEDVERALGRLADGRHVRLSGVGHGLQTEDPSAVLAAVSPFLAALRP